MRARLRLGLALALAGLVHILLFSLPMCERDRTQVVVRPVHVLPLPAKTDPTPATPPEPTEAVPARPEPQPPEPVADAQPPPEPKAPLAQPSSAVVAAEPEPVAAVEPTPPPVIADAAPQESPAPSIDLFPTEAIERAATPPGATDELSDEELFGSRMARWTAEHRAREAVVSGQTPRTVTALGERMWMWYLPGSEELERHSAAGLGEGSSIVPLIEFYRSGRANKPSEAMANLWAGPTQLNPTGFTLANTLCVGFCSDVGHEVARLETTVVVHHDETGLPDDWNVTASSGDRAFDAEALSAIETALEMTAPEEISGGGQPARQTDWVFRVIAYRWSRIELTDPGFIPPGKELEEYSSLAGKTTMVREVRLVAIRFR